jgi:hypothetical protein
MAEVIIIEGPSGTGKTTSLRNINPIERKAVILTPNTKPLPFRGGDAKWGKTKILIDEINMIPVKLDSLTAKGVKLFVIEDFSHFFIGRILSDGFMAQSSGNAVFERWKFFARDVMQSIFLKAAMLPTDVKIVILHHTDINESGYSKFKIFGKLLADHLDPVSYVRIVLQTTILADKENVEDRFVFQTQQDNLREAKTPMGMFEHMYIPNDLEAVLQAIEAYDAAESVAPVAQ